MLGFVMITTLKVMVLFVGIVTTPKIGEIIRNGYQSSDDFKFLYRWAISWTVFISLQFIVGV